VVFSSIEGLNMQSGHDRGTVVAHVVALDANQRRVHLSDGQTLAYERLSLDVGSETDVRWLQATGPRLLPIKPLDRFIAAWPRLLAQAGAQPGFRLCVVGGGAAGFELALAARHALRRHAPAGPATSMTSASGAWRRRAYCRATPPGCGGGPCGNCSARISRY